MMRLRSASVIAALSLLASVATAHAECAWVLWWEETTTYFSYRTADANAPTGKMDEGNTHSWNILGSYASKGACEKQRDSKMSSMLKSWKKDKGKTKSGEHTIDHDSGSNTIVRKSASAGETTSTYSTSLRYLCVPDTVDPRGTKGS